LKVLNGLRAVDSNEFSSIIHDDFPKKEEQENERKKMAAVLVGEFHVKIHS
jgi:hypothetical protein